MWAVLQYHCLVVVCADQEWQIIRERGLKDLAALLEGEEPEGVGGRPAACGQPLRSQRRISIVTIEFGSSFSHDMLANKRVLDPCRFLDGAGGDSSPRCQLSPVSEAGSGLPVCNFPISFNYCGTALCSS